MQQTCTKGIQDLVWLGEKGDPLGIMQEVKILPFLQMLCMHKPESVTENETHKILWDFDI